MTWFKSMMTNLFFDIIYLGGSRQRFGIRLALPLLGAIERFVEADIEFHSLADWTKVLLVRLERHQVGCRARRNGVLVSTPVASRASLSAFSSRPGGLFPWRHNLRRPPCSVRASA